MSVPSGKYKTYGSNFQVRKRLLHRPLRQHLELEAVWPKPRDQVQSDDDDDWTRDLERGDFNICTHKNAPAPTVMYFSWPEFVLAGESSLICQIATLLIESSVHLNLLELIRDQRNFPFNNTSTQALEREASQRMQMDILFQMQGSPGDESASTSKDYTRQATLMILLKTTAKGSPGRSLRLCRGTTGQTRGDSAVCTPSRNNSKSSKSTVSCGGGSRPVKVPRGGPKCLSQSTLGIFRKRPLDRETTRSSECGQLRF